MTGFTKRGESLEIRLEEAASCIPEVNEAILESFAKTAAALKKIAPKADDFLYFSATIIHAAEASSINDDGTPKLNTHGEQVKVGWDLSNNTWKWQTNDPSIKPYKNSNGDIFPESELIKAYKKWQHKPLCVDHKSSSVDHTRGFIVDTYYDRNLKRVVALCALDKANYPELSRKIATKMQTAVSMGTAVGRAICYDCGRVARTENDFCKHMQSKSCYGEINVDLNPIELSIVVTGADPKAHIKQIIASANTMNSYLENRVNELHKLAGGYQATIIKSNGDNGGTVSDMQTVEVKGNDLEAFKTDIERGLKDLEKMNENVEKNTNSSVSNQSSGSIAPDEGAQVGEYPELQFPPARFASADVYEDSAAEFYKVAAQIESKLTQMKTSLDKLSQNLSIRTQEENMSGTEIKKEGYFLGGGGVNEPTPGQVKYPKDGLNEQLREKEDKHMVGQSPFPEVGPVDGMHPSPESVDPSDELQRKKMLARAELEDRAMKRNAIVQMAKESLEKKSYFMGGGGVNEPTPGKPKYPKDKLNEELREDEDKQMVGKPPFPGVGPVDGLLGGKEELKKKELLSRAALRARFNKVANTDGSLNKSASEWQVFQNDKLILKASVSELCGGHVTDVLYDSIATKPFGVQLLDKVKVSGADAVSRLIKKAQVPPPPGGDLGAPEAGPDMGAGPGPEATPSVEDAGKTGDPKQSALDLAEKMVSMSSDLLEAVRALTGEKAEMGEESAPGGMSSKSASDKFSTGTLYSLRKELNGALTQAMKESLAEIDNSRRELEMISGMYNEGAINDGNADITGTIIQDSINEAKTAMADGFRLMTAFVKYARGTKSIIKRAEVEAGLQSLAAEGESTMKDADTNLADLIDQNNADLNDLKHELELGSEEGSEDLDPELMALLGDDVEADPLTELPTDSSDAATPDQVAAVLSNPNLKMASFDSRLGRTAMRAKLAADATGKQEDGEIHDMSSQKFSDMLDQADRLANGQTKLDTKPSDNLGKVETLEEVNDAMMDLAKAPPSVRKDAAALNKLIKEGKVDPKDIDDLVAQGLDKDAAAYWKKYYGEVDGGSEFASELIKEHVKSAMAEELNKFKVKLARAYETAYDMSERGMCRNERSAISAQVEEIMKFSDDNFESLKRIVANHDPIFRKEASRIPQVGYKSDSERQVVTAAVETDAYSQLSALFGSKKGIF